MKVGLTQYHLFRNRLFPRALAGFGLVLCLLHQLPTTTTATADAARQSFDIARKFLEDGFFQRAAEAFHTFVEEHPDAQRTPLAVLLEAQAHFRMGNYRAVRRLLWNHLWQAGKWADEYYYWQGEAYFRLGQFKQAAQRYHWLTEHFPDSRLAFEAAYNEALAHHRLGSYREVIRLLQDPEEPFLKIGTSSDDTEFLIRGRLLLAEAYWSIQRYRLALATLNGIGHQGLSPKQEWEATYLRSRVQLAQHNEEKAVALAEKLLQKAQAIERRGLEEEALALQGTIFKRFGHTDKAISAYAILTTQATDTTHRRHALISLVDLRLRQGKISNAAKTLDRFLRGKSKGSKGSDKSKAAFTDLLHLALGELYLRQYYQSHPPSKRDRSLVTKAESEFEHYLDELGGTQLAGKAHLGLGWCRWERGEYQKSQAAFAAAVKDLGPSTPKAIARVKLADTLFLEGQFDEAISQYDSVTGTDSKFIASYPAEDRAIHQIIRAQLAAGDVGAAGRRAKRALNIASDSDYNDDNLLLVAQAWNRKDRPKQARNWLQKLLDLFSKSQLTPEAEVALARSYVESGNWERAIEQYDAWVEDYPEHSLLPRVRFDRAWVYYQSGKPSQALKLFQAFLHDYPDHSQSPKAQFWIADYHLRNGHNEQAEAGFQRLYQNTNWPPSEIKHRARLMAGKAAVARQGYNDAMDYFRWLVKNGPPKNPQSNISTNLVAKAYFALGDTLVKAPPEGGSRNKLTGYEEAILAFQGIRRNFPDHRLVASALTRIGDCHLQLASKTPSRYKQAIRNYRKALSFSSADITTRSHAEVGLGQALEKQATQTRKGKAKQQQIKEARDHYLNVFYGANLAKDEKGSPFWVHKSGLEAARVSRKLKMWSQAASVYRRMIKLFPNNEATLRNRLAEIEKQLAGQ